MDRRGEGWNANESWNGAWNGVESVSFPAPFGEKMKSLLELPSRASFDTVCGRSVERGGKGWRTAGAVDLYSHYPVGLGEPDTQCLPMSNFVGVMS